MSVGNLPAKATVIIKVTYIMELKCSYSSVSFSIPGTVASWQEDQALKENTQVTVLLIFIILCLLCLLYSVYTHYI